MDRRSRAPAAAGSVSGMHATWISGLLRPPACLACGRPDAWPCCPACLPPEPASPGPWRLAGTELELWTLGIYRAALREAVLAGKLGGQAAALVALGRRLGVAMAAAGAAADLITPIGARPAAGRPRDHARCIAAGVAGALDVPLVELLAPAAGRDLGRARRDGAPAARPPPRCRRRLTGGRVLVVDDVATTGATLAGAAGALLQAGARRVAGAVLAAAPAAFGPPLAPPTLPRPPPPGPPLAREFRRAGACPRRDGRGRPAAGRPSCRPGRRGRACAVTAAPPGPPRPRPAAPPGPRPPGWRGRACAVAVAWPPLAALSRFAGLSPV